MAELGRGQSLLLAQANAARNAGRNEEAERLLMAAVDELPYNAAAPNMLGLLRLGLSDAVGAVGWFRRALDIDPHASPIWLNLSVAFRAQEAHGDELGALDRALEIDPYLLPAVLAKGVALRRLDRAEEAFLLYRGVLPGIPADDRLPPPLRSAAQEARTFFTAYGTRTLEDGSQALDQLLAGLPVAEQRRARAFAEQRAGRRKVFVQQPTGGHFPFLPAIEFFERTHFPWFAELEGGADRITAELATILDEGEGTRPYVQFEAAAPTNQWADLNNSCRWSAWFLWENGVRHDAHCAMAPRTAALVEQLPLLDIPGKAPTVMFSILQPGTRIPPHTGSTNVRATVHLPLIVPDSCAFRVGAETREWRYGEAWAFDDTIEHEAWNDSDRLRAILIVDVWNPLLTEAERQVARLIG